MHHCSVKRNVFYHHERVIVFSRVLIKQKNILQKTAGCSRRPILYFIFSSVATNQPEGCCIVCCRPEKRRTLMDRCINYFDMGNMYFFRKIFLMMRQLLTLLFNYWVHCLRTLVTKSFCIKKIFIDRIFFVRRLLKNIGLNIKERVRFK